MANSSTDSIDVLRLFGRIIMGVNIVIGLLILFLSGVRSGPEGLTWYPTAIWSALGFIVSGPFAWGVLRGIAQIRDRVEELDVNT